MFRVFVLICLLAAPNVLAGDRETAVEAIKADGPPIMDAMWGPSGWLYVAAFNTGENRDGLARYVCNFIAQHKAGPAMVKIVDYAAVTRNQGFRELGRANCP